MLFGDVNIVGEWSVQVPGCEVSRAELLGWICQAHRAYLADDDEAKRYLFNRIAGCSALTVGQLSILFRVSRQRIYIWLLQQGIDKPVRQARKQGSFRPEAAELMLSIVKTLATKGPTGLTQAQLVALPSCGSPGIVEHLTGLDYRTFYPFNAYRKVTVKVS